MKSKSGVRRSTKKTPTDLGPKSIKMKEDLNKGIISLFGKDFE